MVMGTVAYVKAATTVTEYPLVTFARSIGKNTAELNGRDLKRFLKWLWKTEPYKHKRWQPKEPLRYFNGKLHGHGNERERERNIGKLVRVASVKKKKRA